MTIQDITKRLDKAEIAYFVAEADNEGEIDSIWVGDMCDIQIEPTPAVNVYTLTEDTVRTDSYAFGSPAQVVGLLIRHADCNYKGRV